MGGLEQPRLVFDGAAEAAFSVAEELAFHQFRGNRPTVDRYKTLVGTGALFVDQPGDQFLAAARFSADVHRGLAASEFLDLLAHTEHGGESPSRQRSRVLVGMATDGRRRALVTSSAADPGRPVWSGSRRRRP